MTGLATYYYDSVYVASGDLFNPKRMTCAVDISLWAFLAGQTLRVTNLETGAWVDVAVNDLGYLERAGEFVPRRDGGRGYVTAHAGEQGKCVVVDLAPAAMRVISPDMETVPVSVEIADREGE